MLKRIVLAAAAALAFASPAMAAFTVTPVDVTASNTFPFFGQYKPENLINGSGLSGGLHDADYANMWMTDLSVPTATLVFDLGDVFTLSNIQVWNYNMGPDTPVASTVDRGAKDFRLSISLDGVTFTQVLAGQFTRGTGAPIAADVFDVNGMARYVQLDLDSNYEKPPGTYGYAPIGLSEVRFGAVPEPATWALMIGGFGAAGAMLRRRRVATLA